MKKIILILSGILIILVVIVLFIIFRKTTMVMPILTPTPIITPSITTKITIYPEYLLPTPESLAPPEDPNTYDKLPKDQQEFSSLVVSLPINTNDYMVYFNFADSTFQVTIFTDKGMEDYRKLRQKYPDLKESLFILVDRRVELFKL